MEVSKMEIREIMTLDVEMVRPDVSLQEAAQKMKALDIGLIPVCDGEKLKGMLTDRDITIRATAEGLDPTTTEVADVMTTEVAYCFEDQDVEEAAGIMEAKQIRRMPVLDRNKRLVGIISLGDLAIHTPASDLSAQALKEISHPAPKR